MELRGVVPGPQAQWYNRVSMFTKNYGADMWKEFDCGPKVARAGSNPGLGGRPGNGG